MRYVCQYGERYVNAAADRITEQEGMIFVWDGDRLVGVFDLGSIDLIYLTTGGNNEN